MSKVQHSQMSSERAAHVPSLRTVLHLDATRMNASVGGAPMMTTGLFFYATSCLTLNDRIGCDNEQLIGYQAVLIQAVNIF